MRAPERPIVVVGAGIAGLSVALSIRDRPVVLVTRDRRAASGATPWAQGGIAASWLPEDSPASHARDTLVAGSEANDSAAVAMLTAGARDAVEWLIRCGVQFDQGAIGPALCLEGGHSHPRILHAGGDSSGRIIIEALTRTACAAGNLRWCENADVDGLVRRGERVAGVRLRTPSGHELIEAAAVVMATGGTGALYQWTSNPPECDGTGLVLGMLAGASTADLEFVQFHPTLLCPASGSAGNRLQLISEAVRGAGAILVDEGGRRLMDGVHPRRDLAPRDVVARTVWRARQEGHETFLDARMLGEAWPVRFPSIFAACLRHGVDPRGALIPIVPAPHFHMGGLRVDIDGRTDVAGLYAVGEVACNRVHGANRLASNSLLEGIVFGRRLGALLERVADEAPAAAAAPPRIVGAPGLDAARLADLRRWVGATLGPEREHYAMQALSQFLREDAVLARSRQGILVLAMLAGAIERVQSIGAHFRSDAAAALCGSPAC